jgi:hypothetical protein
MSEMTDAELKAMEATVQRVTDAMRPLKPPPLFAEDFPRLLAELRRCVEANRVWQEATGQKDKWADLGDLLKWYMDGREYLRGRVSELRAEVERQKRLVDVQAEQIALMDKEGAKAVAEARREGMREACGLLCEYCKAGDVPQVREDLGHDLLRHHRKHVVSDGDWDICMADAIHAALAGGEQ